MSSIESGFTASTGCSTRFPVCRWKSSREGWRPDAAERLLIADVRSHGYYDADSERIAGSIRIEPNNLIEEVKNLPKDREIYLYCT